jgi:transposase
MPAARWPWADWLLAADGTHLAIERTGVYWRRVCNLREDHCTVLLVNAHHSKAVPGRKTEGRDCDWLGELLRQGLLQGRFIPPRHIWEGRELTRHRQLWGRDRAAVANRLQQRLESANIQLGQVATNGLGLAGR